MFLISDWYIIPAAVVLDLVFGDPGNRVHPVRWMGKLIDAAEPWFRRRVLNPSYAGILFALSMILFSWCFAFVVLKIACAVHPALGALTEILILYFCISIRSLKKAGLEIAESLREEGLVIARKKLRFIVGRDVDSLDEEGVSRAALETVAENLVDGVISPLFWAGVGGAPFAVMYKMINTLDSMTGYKNERYREFGKASARIDDAANYIPARLSVPVIACVSYWLFGRLRESITTAVVEGRNHTSPNAGYPEAAFAGALGVKLGGANYYGGELVMKPDIGSAFGPVGKGDLERACRLMVYSSLLFVFVSMTLAHFMTIII